jgi:hypothetical protein
MRKKMSKMKETAQAAKSTAGLTCVECVMGSPVYIPCGKPAEYIIKNRDETLPMCAMCADHNVSNRGARLVLKGEEYALTKIEPQSSDDLLGEEGSFEVEAAPESSDKDKKLIAKLAARSRELDSLNAAEEAALKLLTDEKQLIEERDLPNAMNEIGMSSFSLIDGTKIELKEAYYASIPEAKKAEAFAWLEEHGLESIIKRQISIYFGRDEAAWANKFLRDMAKRKRPLKHDLKETVAPQTLKAQISQLADSRVLTEEEYPLFGVYKRRYVKLTAPK